MMLQKILDIHEGLSNKVNKSGLNLSLENLVGIDYDSQLSQDLLAEYEEVIKVVDEYCLRDNVKISKLGNILNKSFSDKFISIIYKNLGVRFYKFNFSDMNNAYFTINEFNKII